MLPNPMRYFVHDGSPLPVFWPPVYVMDRTGVLKVAETDYFRAAVPVANGGSVVGLSTFPVGLELFVPKIPVRLLELVLGHARRVGSDGAVLRPVEQLYHFHYKDGKWLVAIPKQEVGTAHIVSRGAVPPSVVLQLHSHHEMNAYFSKTDDEDNQGVSIYGVIGRIFTEPTIRLRVGVFGDFFYLRVSDVFEGWGPFVE